MKKIVTIILSVWTIHYSSLTNAQELPVSTEQQLEDQTDADKGETEDDAYLQELEQFRSNPINLNEADADELKQLRIVNDLQIANLIAYRDLFGKLISIYELQAVPSWDVNTIRRLLPFVSIATPVSVTDEAKLRFRRGEHSLLLRVTQVLERADGFDKTSTGPKYIGSPQKIFFRYRYVYKDLLQFGLVGDKDAGEAFFAGAQKKGFDFYSFHFFARRIGIVQALALGDFLVNMGQGLVQWQGLAFKKSVDVMGVKRQSAVLRPYSSAGEFYFQRGAGISIKKGKFEVTAFASLRKLSSNLIADTLDHEDHISSFLTSGYHRTSNENEDRNNLTQTAMGAVVVYRAGKWQVGLNGVYYHFSLPVQKREEPYNYYSISGKSWYNMSVDFSYTYKNLHFFGEAASDKLTNKAFINGLLISVDPRVDISVVHRTIGKGYQAVNGNAFTENTYPGNETGFYTGITIRPAPGWKLEAYADLYKFPWLKYLVDAPSHGNDFLAQLTYTLNKQTEVYTRYRAAAKQNNRPDTISVTNFLVRIPKQNWRTHISFKVDPAITLRTRAELVWYNKGDEQAQQGFLSFVDIIYKPMLRPFSGSLRLLYFETDGYDSRIYTYENDVSYSYSIPAFNDKGFRYYLNLNYDFSKKLSCWVRWAQTIYQDKASVGSGADKIKGNRRTEVKAQVRWIF